jgi:methylase of polypeptide subunit release factors
MNAPSALANATLSCDDPEAIAILKKLLDSAPYSEAGIRRVLGVEFTDAMTGVQAPLLDRRLPGSGLLATLIRLFLIGVPVDPALVARDLAPLTPARLASMGLVRTGPSGVEGCVSVGLFDGLLLASDPYIPDLTALPADYVIGVNPTTINLAAVTIRRRAASALDLGTGDGALALQAARHCDRVVGTDINARALTFAAFNAALNGVRNVEFRRGSLFEPVAGETFDLIMCNPPYVISPESGLQFRDSGAPVDSFCRTIVRGFPGHLREGGFASILCNWAHRAGESGTGPLEKWVEGLPCDALLMHMKTESPLDYAGKWNRLLLSRRPEEFVARLESWTSYFQRLGIESISAGAVILRRRGAGTPWVRSENFKFQGDPTSGVQIERMFEAQDWISGSPDVRSAAFGPSLDIVVEQESSFVDGEFGVRESRFRFARGLKFTAELDPPAVRAMTLCDGRRTLGELLDQLVPDAGPEADETRRRTIDAVVRMYALGFLVRNPATPGASQA